MKIAIVGSTGRIGATLTRRLLEAGHTVKALSRGGPALDALVAKGAEPVLGSFDTGAGELDHIFRDVEVAFLMVKTDWTDLHGHYATVAQRFVDALGRSSVRRAVSLTSIGSEVSGETGHFAGFHDLDRKLNELAKVDLVHLRAGWFMENLQYWTDSIAKYRRIGWSVRPDLKLPWIATQDIAAMAAEELTRSTSEHRAYREVGAEDLTMPELAAIVGKEIGHAVDYRFVDRTRPEVEAAFLARGGTPERWLDDTHTLAALNDRRVRFHGDRPPLPTTMATFVRQVWKPRYEQALAGHPEPETFYTWSVKDERA